MTWPTFGQQFYSEDLLKPIASLTSPAYSRGFTRQALAQLLRSRLGNFAIRLLCAAHISTKPTEESIARI
jgi:hypothetical protein